MKNKENMKSFIILGLTVVALIGCVLLNPVKKDSTTAVSTTTSEVQAYIDAHRADMSGYTQFTDKKHVFVKSSLNAANAAFNKKQTGVYLFGFSECPYCNEAVPVLNTVAKANNSYVNYVDIYNQRFKNGKKVQSSEAKYLEIKKHLSKYLDDDTLYVPAVVFVKNGKIVQYHVGLITGLGMTAKETTKLKAIYQKGFDAIK